MKYRDHRGGLRESMETEREVNSIDELKEHLNTISVPFGKEVEEIKFDHAVYDFRNGWDTYYVLQRFKGETEFIIAGMSDGIFQEQ